MSKIPAGPKGHWLLGSLRDRQIDPLGFFTRTSLEYGPVVRYKMAGRTVYMMNDPLAVKHVLQDHQKNYIKGFGFEQLKPILGNGLVIAQGEHWRKNRKLMQPAFHQASLQSFAPIMNKLTLDCATEWASKSQIDIHVEMVKLTLRMAAMTLMSTDTQGGQLADAIGESLTAFGEEANRRITSATRIMDYIPLPSQFRSRKAVKKLNEVVLNIIKEKRAKSTQEASKDLLDTLLRARDDESTTGMSDTQLRDEVMTLILAGHETTANLMSWFFYLMSLHPEWQQKLRQDPKLTELALLETLRLYPPVWGLPRDVLEDDEVLGYKIEKGAVAILIPYAMHRNPKYWEHPLVFNPMRFAQEAHAQLPKYAFFPFGGGPRSCIGNTFALQEAKIIAQELLNRFEFTLVPGQNITPEAMVTLRPKGELKLWIKAVN